MIIRMELFPPAALAAFAVLAGLPTASAVNVPIVDPSFEQPALAPGASASPIPGWKTFGVVLHPVGSVQPTDGVQVGYQDGFPINSPTATLQQVLTATVTPNTVYTLRADFIAGDVPFSAQLSAFTDASVGTGILLGTSGTFTLAAHQTKGATASFQVGAGDPAVGQRIVIVANTYFSAQTLGGPIPRAYFDNFRLDAAPGFTGRLLHGAFGVFGFVAPETARLKAYCDGSVTRTACDITFEFTDLRGALLSQSTQVLQPNTSGFFDLPSSRASGRLEINPGWKIARGSAAISFEIFDSQTLRTHILADWGGRSMARTGNLNLGLANLTSSDAGRLGAYCSDEGSSPSACTIAFEFHDGRGRLLKQSSMTLPPGASGVLDIQYVETSAVGQPAEILPYIRVMRGSAVATFALLDNVSGRTLAEIYPARLASPVNDAGR